MDELQRIGFLAAGRTEYRLAPAISAAGYRVSAVDSRSFVSGSAFTEPVGSS